MILAENVIQLGMKVVDLELVWAIDRDHATGIRRIKAKKRTATLAEGAVVGGTEYLVTSRAGASQQTVVGRSGSRIKPRPAVLHAELRRSDFSGGWHRGVVGEECSQSEPLVADHEEGLLLENRSPEDPAPLIQFEGSYAILLRNVPQAVEEVLGIEGIGMTRPEGLSVKIIRARL